MATGIDKVYLFIHELFGVIWSKDESCVHLVTPHIAPMTMPNDAGTEVKMPGHTYKIGRFKNRQWLGNGEHSMKPGGIYRLKGICPGPPVALDSLLKSQYSAFPKNTFKPPDETVPYSPDGSTPHCHWVLPLPNKIHQLRRTTVTKNPPPDPYFCGGADGDDVQNKIKTDCAISIVQVFEYSPDSSILPTIIENYSGTTSPLRTINYKPDPATKTVNLHIWAQMENETSMDDGMANKHATEACDALVQLFNGMLLKCTGSLSSDKLANCQPEMPSGIEFVELMTLSERYSLTHPYKQHKHKLDGKYGPYCTPTTCGPGTNIYACSPD